MAGSNRSFLSFNVPEVVADCGSERIHCKHHRTDFKCGQLSGDYSAGYMGTELSAGAWYWNRNGSRAEYLDQLVCGAEISVFAPAEKRKEHIVSDEKNCKRSEKPVYFQNFRKNAVLHGQPDYFRFYRSSPNFFQNAQRNFYCIRLFAFPSPWLQCSEVSSLFQRSPDPAAAESQYTGESRRRTEAYRLLRISVVRFSASAELRPL